MYETLIFDFTHLCYRSYHGDGGRGALDPMSDHVLRKLLKQSTLTEEEEKEKEKLLNLKIESRIGLTAHKILISFLHAVKKFPAKEIVVAWDSHSWRYNEFPAYKAGRKNKDRTEEEEISINALYQLMDDLHQQFLKTNLVSLKIDKCEADDIVGIIAKTKPTEKVMVVTSDSDYHQLMKNPNVKIYDPVKQKMVKLSPSEARWELFLKIIRGDSSDSIPSAKPRVRETVIKEWFDNSVEFAITRKDKTFDKLFTRNQKLIDFDFIPEDVKIDILRGYVKRKHADKNQYDLQEWLKFFQQYQLKEMLKNVGEIQRLFY